MVTSFVRFWLLWTSIAIVVLAVAMPNVLLIAVFGAPITTLIASIFIALVAKAAIGK